MFQRPPSGGFFMGISVAVDDPAKPGKTGAYVYLRSRFFVLTRRKSHRCDAFAPQGPSGT